MRLLPPILLSCATIACTSASEPERVARDEVARSAPAEPRVRGEELYLQHCSVCHGQRGRGDGEAAPHLFPPARRFNSGRFRLVSSENGAPSDGDLVATLRRGIPGSAMPAWGWLPDADLTALAAHVRTLALDGLALDLEARAREAGETLARGEAQRIASERLTPDRPIVAGAARDDAPSAARGERLYQERCAQCHAPDGKGERTPRLDEDGTLNWARDFTAGFLKGGDTPQALTCRIRAGMPGTAMPPHRLAAADEGDLIAFVRGLIPTGAAERLAHTRSRIDARRIPSAPEDPDDPVWDEASSIRVVLSPLWWSEAAVLGASLSAVHDGSDIALRLSWPDSTGEVRLFSDTRGSDAAALQISDARQPPLFGMGAPHERTELWHWQALRIEDMVGALDLIDPRAHAGEPPRAGEVRADVPRYQRLLGRLEPSDRANRTTLRGLGSLPDARRVPGEVTANARWWDGEWSVVFRRALQPVGSSAAPLVPGSRIQVACAVWNSAAGDSGARKSISIWQELALAP